MKPILIIHAGAGGPFKSKQRAARIRQKISRILDRAYAKLCDSNALDAVSYAVKLLEDDTEFNAGMGSHLQADGRARLSASIMDGPNLRFAGIINVENIKNPILVARALLGEKDRILCGDKAASFAHSIGFKSQDTRTRQAISLWKIKKQRGCDTVGACALDRFGNLASATSTGGRGHERPGRVSDSAMPVANYADRFCAISVTGVGEEIVEDGLAIRINTRIRDGLNLQQAFGKTFAEVRLQNHRMGAVAVTAKGEITHATTTETLIFGWQKGKKSVLF